VLPVALTGTREMRPKHSLWFGKANGVARMLEPIETKGMTLADVPRLREKARESIRTALVDLRGAPVQKVDAKLDAEPVVKPPPRAEARPVFSASETV
jgi:hypothetical protein